MYIYIYMYTYDHLDLTACHVLFDPLKASIGGADDWDNP